MGRNSKRARQRAHAAHPNGRRRKRERVVQAQAEDWAQITAEQERRMRNAMEVSRLPERDLHPGLLAWAWVPYQEDPNQGKSRPVLLLDVNLESHTVKAAMLTTTAKARKGGVPRLYLEDWLDYGLTRPTAVSTTVVVLPTESMTYRTGEMPEAVLTEVREWLVNPHR